MSTSAAQPWGKDHVRDYLVGIGKYELLTADQEVELGRQVQAWQQLESRRKVGTLACRGDDEIIQTGKSAQNQMVEANLRFVVNVAKKYQNRNLDLLELVQEGTLGLIRATEKFEPEQGYKFSTYAHWWIRQGITRAIAQKSRNIRLPIHITDRVNAIKKASREFQKVEGRTPKLPELVAMLKMTEQSIQDTFQANQPVVSLDIKVGQELDSTLMEMIENVNSNRPDEVVRAREDDEVLALALNSLTPVERAVVIDHFGLRDGVKKTLEHVGERQSLTKAKVVHAKKTAFKKLGKRKELRELLVE